LVVTVMVLALSAALLVQALAMERDPPASRRQAGGALDRRLAGLLLVVLFAYIVLLPVLGFILATVPFFAVLMVLFGERRPLPIAIGALAMTAVLYVLFRHGFGIFLPRGLLAGIVA
jgi:putative tricarboxylic transport membrane protein